ncbi:hypothetical protein BASA81_002916 [Batrachochytrium salamandrivorans]|nr:hypothetical protein BASA81_002916 [Batrachochytrium salamandrivorans]
MLQWWLGLVVGCIVLRLVVVEFPLTWTPSTPLPTILPVSGYHETELTHVLVFPDFGRDPVWQPKCSARRFHLVVVTEGKQTTLEPGQETCFASARVCVLPQPANSSSSSRRQQVEAVFRGECLFTGEDLGYGLFVFSQQVDSLDELASSLTFPTPLAWVVSGVVGVFGSKRDMQTRPIVYRMSSHPTRNSPSTKLGIFPKLYLESIASTVNQTESELDALWAFAAQFKTNYDLIRFQLAHRVQFNARLPGDFLSPITKAITTTVLSHVVIALPLFQLDALEHTVHTYWRGAMPPCAPTDFATQDLPALVVLVAVNPNNSHLFDPPAVLSRLQLESFPHCFSKVEAHSLHLTLEQDNRVHGSKLLFERFLNRTWLETIDGAGYALYLEPDMIPTKPRCIFLGPTGFWRKKWLPRKRNADHLYFHLNGNAMYWLGDDGEFPSFYFDQIKPYITQKHGHEDGQQTAMDLDFFDYLFRKRSSHSDKNQLISRLRYTGLIGNLYFDNNQLAAQGDYVLVHSKPSDKWDK